MSNELDELNNYVKKFGEEYSVIFENGEYSLMNFDFEHDMPITHSDNPQSIKDFFYE